MSPKYFIQMIARMTTTSETKTLGYTPMSEDVEEALDNLIATARKITLN